MTNKLKLSDIAEMMRDIDICMFTTQNEKGGLESRPMSNNRDVEFDGHCYFFTLEKMSIVKQIQLKSEVNLAYVGKRSLLGAKKIYLSLSGHAELITDKEIMRAHWVPDLEAWFKKGVDTPGLTLIHVTGDSLQYWDGMEEGLIRIPASVRKRVA